MGEGPKVDLLKEVVPEQFQPVATAFERAAADGITVTQVAPMYQAGSGLTRAALRGGDFRPSFSSGDLVDGVVSALGDGDRSLVYAYHGDLDVTGHVRGPNSEAWALELAQIDLMVRLIAERLPAGAAVIVTADHGMVQVDSPIDFDRQPELQAGVRALGGEPRARHVYAEPGATDDVAAACASCSAPTSRWRPGPRRSVGAGSGRGSRPGWRRVSATSWSWRTPTVR
jgi:hypothetical protein